MSLGISCARSVHGADWQTRERSNGWSIVVVIVQGGGGFEEHGNSSKHPPLPLFFFFPFALSWLHLEFLFVFSAHCRFWPCAFRFPVASQLFLTLNGSANCSDVCDTYTGQRFPNSPPQFTCLCLPVDATVCWRIIGERSWDSSAVNANLLLCPPPTHTHSHLHAYIHTRTHAHKQTHKHTRALVPELLCPRTTCGRCACQSFNCQALHKKRASTLCCQLHSHCC